MNFFLQIKTLYIMSSAPQWSYITDVMFYLWMVLAYSKPCISSWKVNYRWTRSSQTKRSNSSTKTSHQIDLVSPESCISKVYTSDKTSCVCSFHMRPFSCDTKLSAGHILCREYKQFRRRASRVTQNTQKIIHP